MDTKKSIENVATIGVDELAELRAVTKERDAIYTLENNHFLKAIPSGLSVVAGDYGRAMVQAFRDVDHYVKRGKKSAEAWEHFINCGYGADYAKLGQEIYSAFLSGEIQKMAADWSSRATRDVYEWLVNAHNAALDFVCVRYTSTPDDRWAVLDYCGHAFPTVAAAKKFREEVGGRAPIEYIVSSEPVDIAENVEN
nr:hypothetical protein [Limosilactobacillus mucosae]